MLGLDVGIAGGFVGVRRSVGAASGDDGLGGDVGCIVGVKLNTIGVGLQSGVGFSGPFDGLDGFFNDFDPSGAGFANGTPPAEVKTDNSARKKATFVAVENFIRARERQ